MPSAPPLLATTWRGTASEVAVRGDVAVVDADGSVLAATGDAATVVTLRSCVKPIQALPFIRVAADRLGVDPQEVAVACGSHSGEDDHVATVRRLLARVNLDDAALACGPQLPFDEDTTRRLLAAGEGAQPIRNNCSGKHAAMLATCVVAGWPTTGYIHRDHPCQQAVDAALTELLGVDVGSALSGTDGCGLPTYAVPLAALARSFAVGSADPGFRRCQTAMAAQPHFVAGTGRFDSALLREAGVHVTAKIGGAAVWAAVVRPDGPGVALKLEAGVVDAVPPIAITILQRIGALPERLPPTLAAFAQPRLINWAGDVVGETRVEPDAFDFALQLHRPL